jgi:hypothetical protein
MQEKIKKVYNIATKYLSSLGWQMALFIYMNVLVDNIKYDSRLKYYYILAAAIFVIHTVAFIIKLLKKQNS